MEDLPDFEDAALADLLGDARVAYRNQPPVVSPALAELFDADPKPHRSASMRRVLAQLVTATTVVVAATGGLAVAGALPAPVQDAVSSAADDVGVDLPQGDDTTTPGDADETTTTVEESTTTTVDDETSEDETADDEGADDEGTDDEGADDEGADDEGTDDSDDATHPDNHGAAVSEVAHDKSLQGCEHGRAVSSVASGKVKDKPCPHTEDDATTPTTIVVDEPEATEVPDSDASEGKKPKPAQGRGRGHAKHGG